MSARDPALHPCFKKDAAASCGRVHLPVAPTCNILCNYCNRKYDCVNESRPGVTSAVLSPRQAADYLGRVLEKDPRIRVAGIAGPGDPMANAAATLETLRLIKERYPHMLFCLSSNGLGMPPHLDALAELGVTHATVTINAVDPVIGAKMYAWAREGKVVWRGQAAAELMLERQIASVSGLVARGVLVKVNTILTPGVNENHVAEVARVVAGLGATLMNVIPLHPAEDTPFAGMREPDSAAVDAARQAAGEHIRQMLHCKRCRADAVGLLDDDRSRELAPLLRACATRSEAAAERPFVAVATREGMLVNQHLGEALKLQIWGRGPAGPRMVEERIAPRAGCGPDRWRRLGEILKDCRGILAAACGESPRAILAEKGIAVTECSGVVEDAVDAVFNGQDLSVYRGRKGGVSKGCCRGGGSGC